MPSRLVPHGVKAEAGPLDLYYTRSEDYGDNFVKIPWVIGGENSNAGLRGDGLALRLRGQGRTRGAGRMPAQCDVRRLESLRHLALADLGRGGSGRGVHPLVSVEARGIFRERPLVPPPDLLARCSGITSSLSASQSAPLKAEDGSRVDNIIPWAPQKAAGEFAWFPRLTNPDKQTGN